MMDTDKVKKLQYLMTTSMAVRRQLGLAMRQHPRSSCYASRAAAVLQLDQGDWMHLRREELEKIMQKTDSEERMIEETASDIVRAAQAAREKSTSAGLTAFQKAGKMLANVLKIKAFSASTRVDAGQRPAG